MTVEVLLADAAGRGEGGELPLIERLPRRLELLVDGEGEREIHVVAAEQNVIADRLALQRELSARLRHADEREVAGAAADVDHQQHVSGLELLAPALAHRLEP